MSRRSDTTDGGQAESGRGITRRELLKAGAAVGVAGAVVGTAGVATAVTAEPPPPETPDLVLTRGRIHTMDAQGTVLDSVAIKGNRFVPIDRPGRGAPQSRVIDLRGRTVVPGIVEPHVHSISMANRPGYHTPLELTDSIAELQDALAARRPDVPEGAWITSMGGWHPNQWAEQRYPTLQELDEAVPDRPVFLYERFTGPCVTNTLGKAFFDAKDAEPPVHPDVVPVATSDSGFIAGGGFTGGPSATALYYLRLMQTYEDKIRSTRDTMAYSVSLGLTTHLDQVLFPIPGPLAPTQVLSNLDQYTMYDPWIDLHRRGESIVRLQINHLHNQSDPALPELRERLKNSFQFFGDDMLMTGSIGEWAAPLGAGATWQEAQRLVAEAQWRNENSVQDLAGLAQVVEAYEAMEAQYGISHLRWMVHHVPFVNTELLDRLHAIGCAVQMAAYRWVVGSGSGVGSPFRTIVDHPIKTGIHGDGVHIAPLSPWPHIQYATTGRNSLGEQINEGESITRHEALRLFTQENAWFLKMEDKVGSIEPGKLADLAVLDRDVFSVPDADLRKTRSVLTFVDGNVVHDSGEVRR